MQQHTPVTPLAIALPLLVFTIVLVAGAWYMRRRGYGRIGGGTVIVRCREGHLFTTIWIAGLSLKAVRLGPVRFQFCPVGGHWAFVRIVDPAELTDAERRFAERYRDSNIP